MDTDFPSEPVADTDMSELVSLSEELLPHFRAIEAILEAATAKGPVIDEADRCYG